MMPADGLEKLKKFDAIYFGAVGEPDVPDHITLWGLRLAICQPFDQYANVRPTRVLPGITSPLRHVSGPELDWVIVRENSEGEYAGVGGRVHNDWGWFSPDPGMEPLGWQDGTNHACTSCEVDVAHRLHRVGVPVLCLHRPVDPGEEDHAVLPRQHGCRDPMGDQPAHILAAAIGGIGKGADQQRHMVMLPRIRHAKADRDFIQE